MALKVTSLLQCYISPLQKHHLLYFTWIEIFVSKRIRYVSKKSELITSIVYLLWLLLWKSQINSKIQIKATIHARIVKRMSLNSAGNAHVAMHPKIRLDDN